VKLLKRRGFTLIELMIVVAIIGILAALAIPNFIRFQARSKQSEAKANLKSLFTAQRSWYQEHDAYDQMIHKIGFNPERGNRYVYMNGSASKLEDRTTAPAKVATDDQGVTVDSFKYASALSIPTYGGASVAWQGGAAAPAVKDPGSVAGTCPVCEFSGVAAGNIDNETTGIDSWIISSVDATVTPAHEPQVDNVPAGQPENTYNDVNFDT
jgi:type IV pilus assembly protein PilA